MVKHFAYTERLVVQFRYCPKEKAKTKYILKLSKIKYKKELKILEKFEQKFKINKKFLNKNFWINSKQKILNYKNFENLKKKLQLTIIFELNLIKLILSKSKKLINLTKSLFFDFFFLYKILDLFIKKNIIDIYLICPEPTRRTTIKKEINTNIVNLLLKNELTYNPYYDLPFKSQLEVLTFWNNFIFNLKFKLNMNFFLAKTLINIMYYNYNYIYCSASKTFFSNRQKLNHTNLYFNIFYEKKFGFCFINEVFIKIFQ